MKPLPPAKRFMIFKQSIDGNQTRFDHIRGLTLDDINDTDRFPLGKQTPRNGQPFVWTHSLDTDTAI